MKDGLLNYWIGVVTNQNISRKLNPPDSWQFIQGTGKAEGHLIGGCVEVLQFITGTEIWPSISVWENAVLFLETSEEGMQPYQVERFLRNLGAQKILQRLNGILFSKPGGHLIDPIYFNKYNDCILKVLKEFNRVDLHVVTNMDFGHSDPMMTLPFGKIIQIDVEAKEICILDNGVA